jgi:hypothetical protein
MAQGTWSDKKLTVPKGQQSKLDRIQFQGGFNTETPPLEMPSGYVIDAENFEVAINGGYRRIGGYEIFDGQAKPSEQVYYTVPSTGMTLSAGSVGDTITGVGSGATAKYIGQNANGFHVANITGVFAAADDMQISAVSVGTASSSQSQGGASTTLLDATYKNLAADQYRSIIAAPTGSGKLRGIKIYNGDIYAFRDNVGGTACDMWKSTSSGWSQISLGYEAAFNLGNAAEIVVGDTVTGAVSGESGVVTGVAKQTGAWNTDAQGTLIFASITGSGFNGSEALQVSAVTLATSTAVSAAITLEPGGRFQFDNFNLKGDAGSYKMYGCDNVSRAFEFDGTTFIPITTGMVDDTPKFIAVHNYHLFLAFESSLQSSGTGDPYAWTPVLGASELGLGDIISGLYPQVGSGGSAGTAALLCTTRNRTFTLYGTSLSDWSLVETEHEAGALPYTLDKVGHAYMLDDRGVRQFGSSDTFGNFSQSTITKQIQSWLSERKPLAVDSHIVREKDQYRIFFSNGYALFITIYNNQLVGMMPIRLPIVVSCSDSAELSDGTEATFVGGEDGNVYEMEKGTSFNGELINYGLQFAYHHIKTPNVKKRFRKVSLEIKGDAYVTFNFNYELGYGAVGFEQPVSEAVVSSLTTFNWDAFSWDDFFWDGKTLTPSSLKLEGSAENISLIIAGSSEISNSFTLTGAIIHYSPRRRERS